MLETLKEDGQPIEAGWPYLTILPGDLSNWAPPATSGDLYRRASAINPNAVSEVIRLLDEERPSLIAIMLSDAFYRPGSDGVIAASASEPPDPTRRHAVVAAGHGLSGGERLILIRNSWGANWGIDGYAWLTKSFLDPRLFAVIVLTEEIDVPSSTLAA